MKELISKKSNRNNNLKQSEQSENERTDQLEIRQKIAATHSHNAVQDGLAQISPRFSGDEEK